MSQPSGMSGEGREERDEQVYDALWGPIHPTHHGAHRLARYRGQVSERLEHRNSAESSLCESES